MGLQAGSRRSEQRVSVVLPTHNGARFLAESLDSCLGQSYRELEVIVVDDGSTDATSDILRAYEMRDPRVRVLRRKTRVGLPAALNLGFEAARGDFLTWTSDDNIYHPDALQRLLDVLRREKRLDVVYADSEVIDAEGTVVSAQFCREADYLPECYCVGACFLYRRRVMERVGRYTESAFLAEDYDFFLRAWLTGCRMRRLPELLYRYRLHDDSLGSVYGADRVNAVAEAVRRRLLPAWRRHWLRFKRRLRVLLAMVVSGLRRLA